MEQAEGINPDWVVKGTKGYTPKKKPIPKGRLVFTGAGVKLYQRREGRRPWAQFCAYILDKTKRKRSFYLNWNGERFAGCGFLDDITEREPAALAEVTAFLQSQPFERFNALSKRRRDDE